MFPSASNKSVQKSGHGSYVDLPNGETYLVHLTSRPFVPELRCTLGRETAIQKMQWTSDGWLRMADGSNLAKIEVEEPNLPDVPMPEIPNFDDFDGGELGNWYYSPRQMPSTFANATERPGWLRVRGEESLASLNRTSLLTRKLTSVYATVTTKMEFEPEVYQHSAGVSSCGMLNIERLALVSSANVNMTLAAAAVTPAPAKW